MKSLSAILSGGQSRRMGKNKALLAFDEQTAIERIASEMAEISDDLIVISNHPEVYPMLDYPIFRDIHPDMGPLAGLESAMKHRAADVYFLTACDMPFVSSNIYQYLLEQLEDYDAVIPIYNGREHPLSGVYKPTVLPFIEKNLQENKLSMKAFYQQLHVNFVADLSKVASNKTLDNHFFNMNRPKEYDQALEIYKDLK